LSSQGRKPAAVIAELEDNLAQLKKDLLERTVDEKGKRKVTPQSYHKVARALERKIAQVKQESLTS